MLNVKKSKLAFAVIVGIISIVVGVVSITITVYGYKGSEQAAELSFKFIFSISTADN